MQFEPEYFSRFIEVFTLTLLMAILPILFSENNKISYNDYIYRTPAYFKIEFYNQILCFKCNEKESEKVIFIFKNKGIETNFYNKKEAEYR